MSPLAALQVHKPQEVCDAEQAGAGVSDDTIMTVVTAYNVSFLVSPGLGRNEVPFPQGWEKMEWPFSGAGPGYFISACDLRPFQ